LSKSSTKDTRFDNQVYHTNNINLFFSKIKFDAVIICTPIHLHYLHIKRSIKANKWIFIEKPLVGSLSDLAKIKALPENKREKIFVAENFRYLPSLIKLKYLIDKKKSKPLYVRLQNFQIWSKNNKYLNTKWRKDPLHQGGILLDSGIHLISVLNWFFLDSTLIWKNILSLNKDMKENDTIFAKFISKLNILIDFNLSFGIPDDDPFIIKIWYKDISYRCSKNSLEIFKNGKVSTILYDDGQDISKEYDSFYQFILGGKELLYNMDNAIYDTEFCFSLLKDKK